MRNQIWMGPRGHEEWIKAPAPKASWQASGWSSHTTTRNGRVTGRRSRVTHMEYDLNWPTIDFEQGRKVSDWFYGVHGDERIHWLDPTITNVLPAHWSFPGLGCTDGPVISGTLSRPQAITTTANSKDLPSVAARLSGDGDLDVYVPVPPGHTAHIGVHLAGTLSQAASVVVARKMDGRTGKSFYAIPGIPAGTNTIYSQTIPHDGAMTGITLQVLSGALVGGVTTPAFSDVAGIMVEILPTGVTPTTNKYVRGGGNVGCRLFDPPTEVILAAHYQRMSVAATLVESDE